MYLPYVPTFPRVDRRAQLQPYSRESVDIPGLNGYKVMPYNVSVPTYLVPSKSARVRDSHYPRTQSTSRLSCPAHRMNWSDSSETLLSAPPGSRATTCSGSTLTLVDSSTQVHSYRKSYSSSITYLDQLLTNTLGRYPSLNWDISLDPSLSLTTPSHLYKPHFTRPDLIAVAGCNVVFIVLSQSIPETAHGYFSILINKERGEGTGEGGGERGKEGTEDVIYLGDIMQAVWRHFQKPISRADIEDLYSPAELRKMHKSRSSETGQALGKLRARRHGGGSCSSSRGHERLKRVDALQGYKVFGGFKCLNMEGGRCVLELSLRKAARKSRLEWVAH